MPGKCQYSIQEILKGGIYDSLKGKRIKEVTYVVQLLLLINEFSIDVDWSITDWFYVYPSRFVCDYAARDIARTA